MNTVRRARSLTLRDQQTEAAKLDTATAACLPARQANLEELGYGD